MGRDVHLAVSQLMIRYDKPAFVGSPHPALRATFPRRRGKA